MKRVGLLARPTLVLSEDQTKTSRGFKKKNLKLLKDLLMFFKNALVF
jgi:hypothetical protein